MAFDQSHADALAEAETLRQELAALRGVEAKLGVAEAELARSEAVCATAMAEVEALKADLAKAAGREAETLKAERDRLQRSVEAWTETARLYATNSDYWRERASRAEEVVDAAKAVRELWRYDAMAATEPEIHAFAAAVDALSTKDGA